MDKPKLSNAEFEALLLYIFVSVSLGIRAVVIFRTPQSALDSSSFYSALDSILPYNLWGFALIIAAALILLAPISQTRRRYYILIVGNAIGAIFGIAMASVGFVESYQTFTPLQLGSIAFFNVILVIHGGKCLWNERAEIHSLREMNSTKQSEE